MKKNEKENKIKELRPPVVVIMGHVDHGKSTLLDYIRNTNIVDTEAGGITQHISSYEVIVKDENNLDKKITFIDTPGHEAFSKMRERGANIADIAILIISAEDGVKNQTKEAWETIQGCKIPAVIAINKIDKENANIQKTKNELAENGIYIEGYGGNTPYVEISAKNGKGVDELLSIINILSEMEEFSGNKEIEASGFIVEANIDSKRGIQATLVIKDGVLKKGMCIVSGSSICPVKIIEDFKGKKINEATFSSPICVFGFDKIPKVGNHFLSFWDKKEAMQYSKLDNKLNFCEKEKIENEEDLKIIPIIIKTDTSGSLEAIEKEIKNIKCENAIFKIIQKGEGDINEKDLKGALGNENAIVLGFNVKIDNNANILKERDNIEIEIFNIIYKLKEFLEKTIEEKRPKIECVETIGIVKILKTFSRTKNRQILGGKVADGTFSFGNVKIKRKDFEIGSGKIVNLEKNKIKVQKVEKGEECGMMIESKIEIVEGDTLENFVINKK